jgi:hypothetical protein
MGKDLVIARVGPNSLHRTWLDQGKPRDIPSQEGLDLTVGNVIPGPKWTGLRELLNSWDGWREYDYIWLPDDDIFASQDTISRMFEAARALNLQLFAPALSEGSYYAHFIAMRNRNFFARRVGFVEIMIPGFSRAALELLLPTLDLSTTGWGWGLDSLWPKQLDYRGLGIIDAVPVFHTRPVGAFRDEELSRRVMAESDKILSDYKCSQQMVTFTGIDRDLKDMAISPDELLVKLVDGWQYLQEVEPRILRWIVQHQLPHFSWDFYPTAGAPAAPL